MKLLFACYLILLFWNSNCEIEVEVDNMPVEQWKAFKAEHGKSYSDEEDAKRFEIFKENIKMVEEHNKKYENKETTYKMGINKFSDYFPEEKAQNLGLKNPSDLKK